MAGKSGGGGGGGGSAGGSIGGSMGGSASLSSAGSASASIGMSTPNNGAGNAPSTGGNATLPGREPIQDQAMARAYGQAQSLGLTRETNPQVNQLVTGDAQKSSGHLSQTELNSGGGYARAEKNTQPNQTAIDSGQRLHSHGVRMDNQNISEPDNTKVQAARDALEKAERNGQNGQQQESWCKDAQQEAKNAPQKNTSPSHTMDK